MLKSDILKYKSIIFEDICTDNSVDNNNKSMENSKFRIYLINIISKFIYHYSSIDYI